MNSSAFLCHHPRIENLSETGFGMFAVVLACIRIALADIDNVNACPMNDSISYHEQSAGHLSLIQVNVKLVQKMQRSNESMTSQNVEIESMKSIKEDTHEVENLGEPLLVLYDATDLDALEYDSNTAMAAGMFSAISELTKKEDPWLVNLPRLHVHNRKTDHRGNAKIVSILRELRWVNPEKLVVITDSHEIFVNHWIDRTEAFIDIFKELTSKHPKQVLLSTKAACDQKLQSWRMLFQDLARKRGFNDTWFPFINTGLIAGRAGDMVRIYNMLQDQSNPDEEVLFAKAIFEHPDWFALDYNQRLLGSSSWDKDRCLYQPEGPEMKHRNIITGYTPFFIYGRQSMTGCVQVVDANLDDAAYPEDSSRIASPYGQAVFQDMNDWLAHTVKFLLH